MPVSAPSPFERLHFDSQPVNVNRNGIDIRALLGFPLSDDDIVHLSGAPGGASVSCVVKAQWDPADIGADRPRPGLYFFVHHQWIPPNDNCVGLCVTQDAAGRRSLVLYLKDVSLVPGAAPKCFAGAIVARMVRRCLKLGVTSLEMLAAGGRLWPTRPDGSRWAGYSAWAKYGFDMSLVSWDVALFPSFPHFPGHLVTCSTVQDVLRSPEGVDWWKICGTGWFMTFDCSNANTRSIAILDNALAPHGI